MSDEAEETPPPTPQQQCGFKVFHHEYAKKLILAKAQEAGLPVSFIQKPLEHLWDTMAQQGFALGRATDPSAQQAINSRLQPPANKDITFGFKA